MKTFVILGMHRSATSLVAKGISSIVHVGNELLDAAPSNPWGHFENKKFINLNDRILASAGGSWHNPPPEESILELKNEYGHEIKTLITQESENHDLWGWKDPRTTLTIKLFLPYLVNPHFIACFRDVKEVAASLTNRDGCSIKLGVQLAQEYNKRLLKFLSEFSL